MAATHILHVRTMRGTFAPQIVHDVDTKTYKLEEGLKGCDVQQRQIKPEHANMSAADLFLLYPAPVVTVGL